MIFRSYVWWQQIFRSKQFASSPRRFYIETVIADKSQKLAITINALFTEHLLDQQYRHSRHIDQ